MAVVWIVTTGNSDVKLTSDHQWGCLREQKREELKPCYRDFRSPTEDVDGLFSLPARVMGIVYGEALDTHWQYLYFPLLSEFAREIKADKTNKPDQIIVLLTDQAEAFQADSLSDPDCHYWKDTTRLEPILKHYFDQEFGSSKVQFYNLKPKSLKEGLDNWESALQLVQEEFNRWEISENDRIIVSYQASTPAISSAVQFTSLAKFGERVKFLVSNERDAALTRFLPSSAYLKGIRQQEAKALLKSYDYSGTQKLISPYLDDEHRETKLLLNAAIQWNYAKFEEFASELQKLSDQKLVEEAKNRSQHWWWTAYEAAYLGVVRLEQGNTVEAMFHSFRAVEGLLRQWVDEFYLEEIKQTKHPRWQENERWDRNLNLYGEDLYWFLTLKKSIDQNKDIKQNITPDIFIFGSRIFKNRNNLFHQLKGLQGKKEVFESWRSPNEKQWGDDAENKWKNRVKNCLDFISGETFEFLDKEDLDGKVASLMVKVHQKLERAIENIGLGSSEI